MKLHTFRLKPGKDLKTETENFVKAKDIKAGFIVTCVGGLEQAAMRMAGAQPDKQDIRTYEGDFEITSLVGTVSVNGVHLHGVDHSETIEATLTREVEEELGVPAVEVSSDFKIVYYNIGSVVNAVPRMNLFFKATVPEASLTNTDHVAEWRWFTKDEFLQADLHASFNKTELAKVIFR